MLKKGIFIDKKSISIPLLAKNVEIEVREVIKEVEVPVEVISPISYVAIGLGVVLVVISGVLFTRARQTT